MSNGKSEAATPGVVPASTVGYWNASFDIDECAFRQMTCLHNGQLVGLATRRTLHDGQFEKAIAGNPDLDAARPKASYHPTGDTFPRWDWLVVSFAESGNAANVFADIAQDVAAFAKCFNAFDWTVPPAADLNKADFTEDDIAKFNPNVDMVGNAANARGRDPENSALAFIQDIATFPRSTADCVNDAIIVGADCFGSSFPRVGFREIGGIHGVVPVEDFINNHCHADFYGKVEDFKNFIRYAARAAGTLDTAYAFIKAIDDLVAAVEHSNIRHPEQIANAYQSTIEALGRFHIALQVGAQTPKAKDPNAPVAPAQSTVIIKPPKATHGRKSKGGKPIKRRWHGDERAERLLQIAACVYAPGEYDRPPNLPQPVIDNLRAGINKQSRRATMRAMYNSDRVQFRKTMLGAKDYATVTTEEKEKCINSWAQHLNDYMHDNPPGMSIFK